MATLESRTLSVRLERSFAEVYDFLKRPENFPRWASGLASGLRQDGDSWIAETPQGPARVRFSPENPWGVLDHCVRLGDAPEILIPMRLVPNGDGAELLFTLFRREGMTEAQFDADADWVQRDMERLKRLLGA
jgi:hypothetical protein